MKDNLLCCNIEIGSVICLETVQIVAPCPGCAPGYGLPLSLSLGPLPANIWGQSPSRPRPAWASFQGCLLSALGVGSSAPPLRPTPATRSCTLRHIGDPTKLLNGQVGNVSWQTIWIKLTSWGVLMCQTWRLSWEGTALYSQTYPCLIILWYMGPWGDKIFCL